MNTFGLRTISAAFFLCLSLAAGSALAATSAAYWHDDAGRALPQGIDPPAAFRSLQLDVGAAKQSLRSSNSLTLPSPDGGFVDFVLSDSGTMPPALAAKYPEIRSYVGVDAAGNQARVDVSPLGVNAMVFSRDGNWLVRPVTMGDGADYVSFFRSEASPNSSNRLRCRAGDDVNAASNGWKALTASRALTPFSQPLTTGAIKRDYRIAIAANHQYVQAYTNNTVNPTVAQGLAAVVLAVNRITQVYSNDLSMRFILIANNDSLIFPQAVNSGVPDPFGADDDNNGTNLSLFTSKINAVIGVGSYDVGHVFTTGAGGVAGPAICNPGSKGQGTTGLPNGADLSADFFYIDFVAHEIGHQFTANHIFNGATGFCLTNINHNTAYEPGSGSTILSYAGVCDGDNLQPHNDAYFNAGSLDEISSDTNNVTGAGACGTSVANHAVPVVAAPGNYTIPANTPFALTGSATSSAPGAALTYTWEQHDLGTQNSNLAVDLGNGPIVRSSTQVGPTRVIPRVADLLAGTQTYGEIVPTTNRTMNFLVTVRDNTAGGGTSQSAASVLTVVNTAGPFTVSTPAAGTTWNYAGGVGTATVTWNVASTNLAPVSCAFVKIDLTKGGNFDSPTVIAASVPNTGTALINVPNVTTTSARVRVSCANNIFFNVSPGDFTVTGNDTIFRNGFDSQP